VNPGAIVCEYRQQGGTLFSNPSSRRRGLDALAQFLNSDVAPWNYMMATAIIYALPPIATYYAFRHRMSSGLTMGGVKG